MDELVAVVGGGTPTRSTAAFYGGSVPWVTPKDMKSWEITGAQISITQEGLDNSAARLVPANSVLVVVRSGVLKHTLPVAVTRLPVAINQDMKALLCGDQLDADFLARFLKAQSPIILQWVRATTADNFPIDKLKRLAVPLPPLPEQRRIAEVLDRAEALRAKQRAALAQLDTLPQSLFLEMFGDPVANPRGWPRIRLGDHARKIGSGATPTGGEAAYKESGIALIRSMNVRDGFFLDTDLAFIDEDQAAKLDGVVVEVDDVLLNITGASVARVCRAPAYVLPARVNQHVAIVRPTDMLRAVFLEQVLLSSQVRAQLLRIAGAGATRDAITKTQIEGLELVCPPISVQLRFEEIAAQVDKLRTQHSASLIEIDALVSSLQDRAFRGEL